MRSRRLGYAAVALAAILWAFGGTYARAMFEKGASPIELTEARAWIALVGVGALVLLRGKQRPRSKPRIGLLAQVIFFGLSLAIANLTYYLAISLLPVAVAITIQYTSPAMVVAWQAFAGRRAPSVLTLVSLTAAIVGVALLAEVPRLFGGLDLRLDPLGVGFAAASAITFSTYVISGESLEREFGSERAVLYGFAVASIFWIVVQAFSGRPETLLDPRFFQGILVLGIAGTIAPFLLFIWGLGRVKASAAGITSTIEPLSAALFAFLILGQTLSPMQIVGAAAVLGAVLLLQREKPPTDTEGSGDRDEVVEQSSDLRRPL